MVCFVHFDLEMCFAPQGRALFRDISASKSGPRPPVSTLLTSKCASRHNGVQFFISHLASWLRTRRFSEPTFRPSGATNHWKNTVSRLSYLFAHLHLLSSYSFSSDLLSTNLPLLSASALLCFSSVHIVGSLTSKLPSIILVSCTIIQSYWAVDCYLWVQRSSTLGLQHFSMHKVPQHMQTTIALQHTRANFSPQRTPPVTLKKQCFVQILTFKSRP